jgi:hypothetical protein
MPRLVQHLAKQNLEPRVRNWPCLPLRAARALWATAGSVASPNGQNLEADSPCNAIFPLLYYLAQAGELTRTPARPCQVA